MKWFLSIFLSFSISFIISGNNPGVLFIENKNQWPKKVKFAADLAAGQVFIEEQALVWKLYSLSDIQKEHQQRCEKNSDGKSGNKIVRGHNYKVELVNGQLSNYTAFKIQTHYYNYFLGNNPTNWASDVKAFEEVYFKNVYNSIDLKFYGTNNFKYDFIVKKGGNIQEIKLKYNYVNSISIVNNKLIVSTSIGDITENIPEAYQIINGKKVIVNCEYVLSNSNEIGFKVNDNYNSNYDLIIDPSVVVASYSGTESVSFGLGVAPDNKGNMYLYSMNLTRNYPVTFGAVQTTYQGGFYDCTISKFNATGTSKIFSTYIGGNKDELIINCVIQNNEIAILGTTISDTFPIVASAIQTKYKGMFDYFVMKLDTSGKTLLGSTYLGGERVEGGSSVGGSFTYFNPQNSVGELIMDEFNNCYVIGSSNSINYPVTPGCFKVHSDSNGFSDIVISKLNSNLTSLVWSTFYGGRRANVPVGIKLSKSGKLYCAGTTTSLDFYTTPGVIASTSVTTMDMVVFSLDIASGFPLASTYMGARNSQALRIDIDLNDNVYLIGGTTAPNSFTPTPGAYNINTGNFLFYKTNPNLSQVNVLAKFGYPVSFTGKIEFDAFNVDSCGYVYFGGFAQGGLPVTPDAFKPVGNGDGNIYLGVFNPNFTGLKFATYYGGDTGPANLNFYHDHDDGGLNYFDDRGYFYHANCVNNNFPITTNAYSAYNVKDSLVYPSSVVRNSDAFIKIDLQTFVNANSSLGGLIRSCSPITTTFVANANLGSVTIIPGDGSPSVNTNSLVYTYSVFGTYNAFVVAGSDSSTCNITDSVKIVFKYGPPPFEPLSDTTINCSGKKVILNAGNEGSIYSWNIGQTTQTITPQQSGLYKVFIDNGYCSRTDSTFVLVTQEQDFTLPNAFSPNGDGINDSYCLQGWDFCNESFLIMIFNRWGEKVFQSDNPKFCWNGIYKGQVLSADVYIYTISAKYADDVTINKRGNITLIK